MKTPLTLRTLVDDPALGLSVLEPGAPGALDAPVAWVHNTELPDPSAYLREDELVLTNGIWTEEVEPAEFVENVRRAKAAGIVFGLRDTVRQTPPELIEACRAARLPLLELVIEIPFTDLSQAAASAYADERLGVLEAAVQRGTVLADAISSDAGVAGVLRRLVAEFALPLAVVDRMGHPLALAGAQLSDDDLHAVAEALTRHPPPLEVPIGPAGAATLFPVGVPGEISAALVCLRPAAALEHGAVGALQQAAHFLSMDIARTRAVEATEQRFAAELLDMITSGTGEQADLAHRLRGFGLDPLQPLAVVALAHAHAPVTDALTDTVRQALRADGVPAVLVPGSRDLVVLVTWQHPTAELRDRLLQLTARLQRRSPDRRTVAGYSAPVESYTGLRTPLRQARQACRTLARQTTGTSVATLPELPTHIALLSTLTPADLRRFAEAALEPLRSHDADRGSRLEQTLRVLLERDDVKGTADALHIHVNTLYKRLDRIAALTGRDPRTFTERVDLFLALQADDLGTA